MDKDPDPVIPDHCWESCEVNMSLLVHEIWVGCFLQPRLFLLIEKGGRLQALVVPNPDDRPQGLFQGSLGQFDLIGGSQRCSLLVQSYFLNFMFCGPALQILWFVSLEPFSKGHPFWDRSSGCSLIQHSHVGPRRVCHGHSRLWRTFQNVLLSGSPSSPTKSRMKRFVCGQCSLMPSFSNFPCSFSF